MLIVGGALIGSAGIPFIDQMGRLGYVDCAFVISKFDVLIKSNSMTVKVSANPIFFFMLFIYQNNDD